MSYYGIFHKRQQGLEPGSDAHKQSLYDHANQVLSAILASDARKDVIIDGAQYTIGMMAQSSRHDKHIRTIVASYDVPVSPGTLVQEGDNVWLVASREILTLDAYFRGQAILTNREITYETPQGGLETTRVFCEGSLTQLITEVYKSSHHVELPNGWLKMLAPSNVQIREKTKFSLKGSTWQIQYNENISVEGVSYLTASQVLNTGEDVPKWHTNDWSIVATDMTLDQGVWGVPMVKIYKNQRRVQEPFIIEGPIRTDGARIFGETVGVHYMTVKLVSNPEIQDDFVVAVGEEEPLLSLLIQPRLTNLKSGLPYAFKAQAVQGLDKDLDTGVFTIVSGANALENVKVEPGTISFNVKVDRKYIGTEVEISYIGLENRTMNLLIDNFL